MFEAIAKFFKKLVKSEEEQEVTSKEQAKERLHLVLMQDRANVSADFLEMMKQEIIEVIKKYIDVQEESIDVRLKNEENGDGTTGAPFLYANIPIIKIKNDVSKENKEEIKKEPTEKTKTDNKKKEEKKEDKEERLDDVKEEKKEAIKEDKQVEKEEDKKEETQKDEEETKKEKK